MEVVAYMPIHKPTNGDAQITVGDLGVILLCLYTNSVLLKAAQHIGSQTKTIVFELIFESIWHM